MIFCALGVVRGSGLSKASAKLNFCGPTPLDFYQIVRILCRFTWEGSIGGPQQGARESVSDRGSAAFCPRVGQRQGAIRARAEVWQGLICVVRLALVRNCGG